jgi:hypothetical protein
VTSTGRTRNWNDSEYAPAGDLTVTPASGTLISAGTSGLMIVTVPPPAGTGTIWSGGMTLTVTGVGATGCRTRR